jgi:hypothetical protein
MKVDAKVILMSSARRDGNGCWIWQKGRSGAYGHVTIAGIGWLCHRLSYSTWNGPIAPGYHVHHTCSQKLCCNPDHLQAMPPTRHMAISGQHIHGGPAKHRPWKGSPSALLPPSLRLLIRKMDQDWDRFFLSVRKTGNCWEWEGLKARGYGVFRAFNRNWFAHRFLYELTGGPLKADEALHHLCGNPGCVSPFHLQPLPAGVHTLIGNGITAQNKRKTHCKRGHELTPENLYPRTNGARVCRQCAKDRHRETYQSRGRGSPSSRTHCSRGHSYSPENTRWLPGKHGNLTRECVACRRASGQARRRANGMRVWPKGTATHCPHGHEFTPENTYRLKGRSGNYTRACRECRRISNRRGQYWRKKPRVDERP